jgi:hypothetical protein
MKRVRVMISVDDKHKDAVDTVSRRLEDEGATVERKLPGIGAVTAEVDTDKVERLRRVEGVGYLEQEREISL